MKRLLLALQFLTKIPVTINSEIKEEDLSKSVIYFPLVGGVIGIILASLLLLNGYLPLRVIITLILALQVFITGALHLDGFADTLDGMYGGRTKERILEIMRDSHVGAVGVIGLIILLLVKFEILCALPFWILWKTVISMVIFSRFMQVVTCHFTKYARPDGKAKNFIGYKGKFELIAALLITIISSYLLLGYYGFIVILISMLPLFFFVKAVSKKIDGMTGDTVGAASELAEVIFALVVLVVVRIVTS